MSKFFVDAGPILRSLLRNRTGALLIALQCAITLAIVVNAVFIIQTRLEKVGRPTGMDDANLLSIASLGFTENFNARNTVLTDLQALRALPGVVDVTPISAIPQSGGGSSTGYRTTVEQTPTREPFGSAYYEADPHALNTLGLKLVAGRNFREEEMMYLPERTTEYPRVAIVSEKFARDLFPAGDALGKTIYTGPNYGHEIIGIVERLQAPWVGWDDFERAVLLPQVTTEKYIRYMVRTEPGRRDELMPIVEQTLSKLNDTRIVRNLRSHSDVVADAYREDRAMAILLGVVISLIVGVTALGIVGLATFNVNRRTRQIGTRRALGATQADIVRYFITENGLITSGGVVLGALLAFALNYWLVESYSLDKLDWRYVPAGMLLVWLIGLLAVLSPALKATRIPPAIATRSV